MKRQTFTEQHFENFVAEIVSVARGQVNEMRADVDRAITSLLEEHRRWTRRPLIRTPDGIPDGWHVRVEDGVPVLGRNA